MSEPFDLESTVVHLGRGSTAVPVGDTGWSQWLDRYVGSLRAATRDAWCVFPRGGRGPPGSVTPGEEVVVLLSGRVDVIQDIAASTEGRAATGPGDDQPRACGTADVHGAGEVSSSPRTRDGHRPANRPDARYASAETGADEILWPGLPPRLLSGRVCVNGDVTPRIEFRGASFRTRASGRRDRSGYGLRAWER
jgi:hypothetical protein